MMVAVVVVVSLLLVTVVMVMVVVRMATFSDPSSPWLCTLGSSL